jgi:hypothetical protein
MTSQSGVAGLPQNPRQPVEVLRGDGILTRIARAVVSGSVIGGMRSRSCVLECQHDRRFKAAYSTGVRNLGQLTVHAAAADSAGAVAESARQEAGARGNVNAHASRRVRPCQH